MPEKVGRRLKRSAGRTLFGMDVAGYEAGRLGYPDALFDIVLDSIGGGAGAAMLEIGAGTGLATKQLLAAGPDRFVAVEPDPQLATYLSRRFRTPALEVITKDFVAAPIVGPFDLIVSAASFHWIEPEAGLARIAALLEPDGCAALWWNVYRQSGIGDAFADAVVPLLCELDLPPSEGPAGHYSLDAALHRDGFGKAGFDVIAAPVFRRIRTLDATEMLALYASYSFVRAMDPVHRGALLAAITDIVENEFGGSAPNIVLTPLYLVRRKAR